MPHLAISSPPPIDQGRALHCVYITSIVHALCANILHVYIEIEKPCCILVPSSIYLDHNHQQRKSYYCPPIHYQFVLKFIASLLLLVLIKTVSDDGWSIAARLSQYEFDSRLLVIIVSHTCVL